MVSLCSFFYFGLRAVKALAVTAVCDGKMHKKSFLSRKFEAQMQKFYFKSVFS